MNRQGADFVRAEGATAAHEKLELVVAMEVGSQRNIRRLLHEKHGG